MISQKRQRGVGLIEVLIALLVLSIGLLGLAALQTQALKFNQGAFLRTHATTLAYDIADRMRANREYANLTGYAVGAGSVPTTPPTPTCEAADCTPAAMAGYDLSQWKYALGQRLPGGDGIITSVSGSVSRFYTITVQWDNRDGKASNNTVSLQVRTEI